MSSVPFLKMNGLGNEINVADMRGRRDRVTPAAAIAVNTDPATKYDQIMAIHDPRTPGTFSYIEIINSDGSLAQACGNGMRCVTQALARETGEKAFVFETLMLIVGAVWAQDAWGRYWGWDPLESWAFVTWLALAATLHARLAFRLSPRAHALWLGGVFVIAFLTFFGVPFLSETPHKGAI